MTHIESSFIQIAGAKIHLLETLGTGDKVDLVLLHGASFHAETWLNIGVLHQLQKTPVNKIIAIDLPGYGYSQTCPLEPIDFMVACFEKMFITMPIIIAPSMSGMYALPYLIQHASRITGFVALAPVGIVKYQSQLKQIALPSLAIWGEHDHIVPVAYADLLCQQLPNCKKIIIQSAGHACYLNQTNTFIEHVVAFIRTTVVMN